MGSFYFDRLLLLYLDGTNVYIEESGSLLPDAKDSVVRRGNFGWLLRLMIISITSFYLLQAFRMLQF